MFILYWTTFQHLDWWQIFANLLWLQLILYMSHIKWMFLCNAIMLFICLVYCIILSLRAGWVCFSRININQNRNKTDDACKFLKQWFCIGNRQHQTCGLFSLVFCRCFRDKRQSETLRWGCDCTNIRWFSSILWMHMFKCVAGLIIVAADWMEIDANLCENHKLCEWWSCFFFSKWFHSVVCWPVWVSIWLLRLRHVTHSR